jgi:hypothetical protein
LPIGTQVFAQWKADGYWYPAKLEGKQDGQYDVLYYDGVRERLPASHVADWNVTVGDVVEADWLSRGGYWRAEITSRNGQRIRLRYEDNSWDDTTIPKLRVRLVRQ